jgi:hypothetical protein
MITTVKNDFYHMKTYSLIASHSRNKATSLALVILASGGQDFIFQRPTSSTIKPRITALHHMQQLSRCAFALLSVTNKLTSKETMTVPGGGISGWVHISQS